MQGFPFSVHLTLLLELHQKPKLGEESDQEHTNPWFCDLTARDWQVGAGSVGFDVQPPGALKLAI